MTVRGTDAAGLRAALDELGWKPDGLARRLNLLAASNGRVERVHPKTPYKWLRGEHPHAPWPGLCTALLSEALGRTVTATALGWTGDGIECTPADAGLHLPWTAAGGLQAARIVVDPGLVERRIFLTLVGAAVTPPALEWLIAGPATDLARHGRAPLPINLVDQIDQITDGLRKMDDQLGGGPLLGVVREHIRYVTNLIDNRRFDDTVGRRLHTALGELLRLAGFVAFDSGQHPRAQRFWIAGLRAAHSAGDKALGANILGFMSCQAKDLGQYREAITLAQTASYGYPGANPKVAAILDLRVAEAHANDRAVDACRAAIDAAFAHLDDEGASYGAPGWCYWLDPAQAHAQAGYCYVRLEDWPRARSHLRSALRMQDSQFSREAALRKVLLASTYARQEQPDPDQAAALGSQAVQALSDQIESTRCVGHVARLVSDLTPHARRPAVREFREHARMLLHA